MEQQTRSDLPDHVSPEMVRPFAFSFGAVIDEDPFLSVIPQLVEGPEVFFAHNVFAGQQPGWVFTRSADLQKIYLDTDHFSNAGTVPYATVLGEDWRLVPTEVDPPEHAIYRLMMNPLFAPKVINRLSDTMRAYAGEQIALFAARGQADFIAEFTQIFPVRVFLELMGLPQSMMPTFLEWGHGLLHPEDQATLHKYAKATSEYLRAEIAKRRTALTEDLISHGIRVEVEGRHLSDGDLLGFCFGLFLAGIDTVSSGMAFQFLHLARNIEHQQTLRDDPARIPDAINEFMRAYAPVLNFRTCKKQTEFRGVTIMPGDKVVMFTALAGRDPYEYDRPDEIILDRKPRHISFAYGPHVCIGVHLARLEMRIAIEEALKRLPVFHLAPEAHLKYSAHLVMQPDHLPLRWSV